MGLVVLGVRFTAWVVLDLAPATAEPGVLLVQLDTPAVRPIETITVMSRVRTSARMVISQM